MFQALLTTIRNMRGWSTFPVMIMVIADDGQSDTDVLPVHARTHDHARQRTGRFLARTLPDGWVAVYSGGTIDKR